MNANTHQFLTSGGVAVNDVRALGLLTLDQKLVWKHVEDGAAAYAAYPSSREAADSKAASEEQIGHNLRGVRIGYDPETGKWHYLRLTDGIRNEYHLDAGKVAPDFSELVDRFFDLVVVSEEGLIAQGSLNTEKVRAVFVAS